jgi:hypothetical protein
MADVLPFLPTEPTLSELVNHTIIKWKRAFPLTHRYHIEFLYDYIDWKRGRRDLAFKVAARKRAIDAMLLLCDLYANDEEKKELRKCMRGFMRSRKPYYAELHVPIRLRLREHKVYVQCGLDPPDPDENRKGRAP